MKQFICFIIVQFIIAVCNSSVIGNGHISKKNLDLSEISVKDSFDNSSISTFPNSTATTASFLIFPAISTVNNASSENVNPISSEKKNTTTEEVTENVKPNVTDTLLGNISPEKPNITSIKSESDTLEKIKGNATLTKESSHQPILLIPKRQHSSQSVIIPTLRLYQKYYTQTIPNKNSGKQRSNEPIFTNTATPCPTCGRMICGKDATLCPVCIHSGISNSVGVEKSKNNSQSLSSNTDTGDDLLMLTGAGLRKRRKNAWKVDKIIKPNSFPAHQTQFQRGLRSRRDIWSFFGMGSSPEIGSQRPRPGPGQSLNFQNKPVENGPAHFDFQREEQINSRPYFSQSQASPQLQPNFFDAGTANQRSQSQSQVKKCLYPETQVLIPPQPQHSQPKSNFRTILSAFQ